MNNQNCNKTSNNKYFNCPARMNDGRIMTDYRSANTVNDMIRISNNTLSSYEYRQFLINNGNNIMDINNEYITNKNSCGSSKLITVPFSKVCNYDTQVGRCERTNKRMGVGIKNEVNPNISTCETNQMTDCFFNNSNQLNVNAEFVNGTNTPFNLYAKY
tara:strand:+ start:389 stop:865 length:477 start_codon:yes stop_codon:yes gene_type:complete